MLFSKSLNFVVYRTLSPPAFRFIATAPSRTYGRNFNCIKPDPVQLLPYFPPARMTVLAYRVSKDYVHYSHAEITDSATIRILDSKPFWLLKIAKPMDTPQQGAAAMEGRVVEGYCDEDAKDETKERKKSAVLSEINSSSIAYSKVAYILEKSPSSDVYVVERLPASALRVRDPSLLQIFSELAMYAEILRAQLVTKWRREHVGNEEGTEPSPPRIGTEPIFESNGRYAEKLFELRKSDNVCESLIPIVTKLPKGYSTSGGIIRAEMSDDLMKYLMADGRNEREEMKKNLLCAVILESVAFCRYLLDVRANVENESAVAERHGDR